MGWSWKYFLPSTGKSKAAGWLTFIFGIFYPLGNWQLAPEGKWLQDEISFWECNHLECLVSQISGWLSLWNFDMMFFMMSGLFDLSSSSTNSQIPVYKIRDEHEQHHDNCGTLPFCHARRHSAFKMAEDGPSKGSHEASEGYPCEGLHWLIAQSSWFQLAMLVETRTNR